MSNPLYARLLGLDMVSEHDYPDARQVIVDFSVGPYPHGAVLGVGTSSMTPSYMLSEHGQQIVFNKAIKHTVYRPQSLMPGRWTVKVGTQFKRAPEYFSWEGVEFRIDPPFDNPPGQMDLHIVDADGTEFLAPIVRRSGDALTGGEMLSGTTNTLLFYKGAWRVVTVFNAEIGGTGRSAVSLNGTTVVAAANRIDFFGAFDVQATEGGTVAVVTVSLPPTPPGGGGSSDWNVITNKPNLFPPEAHSHVGGGVTNKPILIEALSALAGNGLIERTGDVLSTIATSPFGKAVLGVADAAALRTLLNVPNGNDYLRKDQNFADIPNLAVAQFNLGLKAAAFLPTDVDGGVPTIVNGKISPSLIDVNLELPPIPVPDEAARLALPDTTPLGTLVVQKTPAGRFFAGALPLSNPANWIDVTQSDLVLSVFGLTGAVDIVDLPVLPPASLDIGDYFVIYDTSAADHKRVTLQALKDALGVGASVAGDEAKGINVTQVSGVAVVSLKTDEMPVLTGEVATSQVSFVVGRPDGSPGTMPVGALPGALPLRTTAVLDTDSVGLAPLAGPAVKTPVARLFTGRTLRDSSVANHNEEYFAGGNRSGTFTLPDGYNTYVIRLVGPVTLILPSDRPANSGLWRAITVVIDQDSIGNRSCAFQAPSNPAGQNIFWPNGGAPSAPALAANARSYFVFRCFQGELRFDGQRVY